MGRLGDGANMGAGFSVGNAESTRNGSGMGVRSSTCKGQHVAHLDQGKPGMTVGQDLSRGIADGQGSLSCIENKSMPDI